MRSLRLVPALLLVSLPLLAVLAAAPSAAAQPCPAEEPCCPNGIVVGDMCVFMMPCGPRPGDCPPAPSGPTDAAGAICRESQLPKDQRLTVCVQADGHGCPIWIHRASPTGSSGFCFP